MSLLYIFVNQQVHQTNKLFYKHYNIATNIAIRKTVFIEQYGSCDLQYCIGLNGFMLLRRM